MRILQVEKVQKKKVADEAWTQSLYTRSWMS